MKKVFIIDNYDSFTYNLAHIFRELGAEVSIKRNDQFDLSELALYDQIVLSPGPGIPCEAGLLLEAIKMYAPSKPILGICLGHQAIGEVFGGTLRNLDKVYHGVESTANILTDDLLFKGLGKEITVGRYHSWVVDEKDFPLCMEITAQDVETGQIMALRHRQYNVRGIQFHPESVLTPEGKMMIKNFLEA